MRFRTIFGNSEFSLILALLSLMLAPAGRANEAGGQVAPEVGMSFPESAADSLSLYSSEPLEAGERVRILLPSLCDLSDIRPAERPPEKVDARDYGFDPADATPALQAAVDSGARLVTVPDAGAPWRLKTVRLPSHVTLAFAPGVTIRGLPSGEPIFTIANQTDVVLRGHETLIEGSGRSTLIRLEASNNVSIIGLALRGGRQGIEVCNPDPQPACRDIYLKSLSIQGCSGNGLLIKSAENLLVADSLIRDADAAGLALLPERIRDRLDARIRNCRFDQNPQAAIRLNAQALTPLSPDLTVTFSNCQITGASGWGAELSLFRDQGPGGCVEFKDCLFYDLAGPGVIAESLSAYGPTVRFRHCTWKRVADSGDAPVVLSGRNPMAAKAYGGVEFDDSLIEDDQDRPGLASTEDEASAGCANVRGRLMVANPYGASVDLGPKAHDNTLEVVDRTAAAPAATPSPTATATPEPAGGLRVYPNPVQQGQLFFRFSPSGPESVWIRLFNLAGELALSQRQEISQSFPVVACSVGHLAAGIYIYLAEEGGRWLKGKIGIAR